MSYDWTNVKPLASPIKTNSNDVILSGHGALASSGTTIIPIGVELWIMAPPGATIEDELGQALESQTAISYLGIANPGSNILINNTPVVYRSGVSVPDYILSPPNGITIKPGGPHIIGVTSNQNLSNLWARVTPLLLPGKTTRVFWAACTAIAGAKNQMVVYK